MSTIAKVLVNSKLSKAQRAEAFQKSKSASAACVESGVKYQRHTIEHLCSRPSVVPSGKGDTFPVVQEIPSSSYGRYIGEQPDEQQHL